MAANAWNVACVTIGLGLTLMACADGETTDDTGLVATDTTPNDTGDGVTYADVAPILETHCLGCHGDPPSGAPFSLASYADASSRAERLVARAVDGDPSPMPPSGLTLSPAEGDILRDWADAGAPR